MLKTSATANKWTEVRLQREAEKEKGKKIRSSLQSSDASHQRSLKPLTPSHDGPQKTFSRSRTSSKNSSPNRNFTKTPIIDQTVATHPAAGPFSVSPKKDHLISIQYSPGKIPVPESQMSFEPAQKISSKKDVKKQNKSAKDEKKKGNALIDAEIEPAEEMMDSARKSPFNKIPQENFKRFLTNVDYEPGISVIPRVEADGSARKTIVFNNYHLGSKKPKNSNDISSPSKSVTFAQQNYVTGQSSYPKRTASLSPEGNALTSPKKHFHKKKSWPSDDIEQEEIVDEDRDIKFNGVIYQCLQESQLKGPWEDLILKIDGIVPDNHEKFILTYWKNGKHLYHNFSTAKSKFPSLLFDYLEPYLCFE